jgi:hypothetical protein
MMLACPKANETRDGAGLLILLIATIRVEKVDPHQSA